METVGVLGTGTMGAGIVQVVAQAGYRVVACDRSVEALERASSTSETAPSAERQGGGGGSRLQVWDRKTLLIPPGSYPHHVVHLQAPAPPRPGPPPPPPRRTTGAPALTPPTALTKTRVRAGRLGRKKGGGPADRTSRGSGGSCQLQMFRLLLLRPPET